MQVKAQSTCDLLRARWCEPVLSVVDVRVGDDEEAATDPFYRFGPTRFSVIPRSAVGNVSVRFVPDQARRPRLPFRLLRRGMRRASVLEPAAQLPHAPWETPLVRRLATVSCLVSLVKDTSPVMKRLACRVIPTRRQSGCRGLLVV